MLIEFLSDVEGQLAGAWPQNENEATKAPKVKPSMGIVDWRKSVEQVSFISDGLRFNRQWNIFYLSLFQFIHLSL